MKFVRIPRPSPSMAVAITALVLVAGGGGWAVAAQQSASTIRACVNKRSGAIRLATRCRRGERKLSWNTIGPSGARGPSGPSNAFEARRDGGSGGAADGTTQTVATLSNLPAGSYVITAKSNVTKQGGGATTSVVGGCTLTAGGDSDTANQVLPGIGIGATMNTQVVHTFPSTGSASLACTATGAGWVASLTKIAAVKVASAKTTAVDG